MKRLVDRGAYTAALAVTAVMLPGGAGLTTSLLYLLDSKGGLTWEINDGGPRSFLYGSALALAQWLVVAVFFQRYGRAESANPTEFARLSVLHRAVATRLDSVPANHEQDLAYKLAAAAIRGAKSALGLQGPSEQARGIAWAAQSGYVVVRSELEAAETALLEYEPAERLLATALQLRSRIDGSRIGSSAALIESLQEAQEELKQPGPALPLVAARLAQVKSTIDEFRDARRYALVSARSSLYGTVLLAGALAYLVLGAALIWGAGPEAIAAGIVFYLVGAVIGLFRQLAAASSADAQTEEDYGLDDVRLIQRPLISGIAGVGGVAVMTIAVALAPTAGGTGQAGMIPSLNDIFSLADNRLGILYAATFGLAPGLLVTRLHRTAEQYKVDLRSTQPSGQGGAT